MEQQGKPIKQIFSNEIKDKVRDKGEYAFLVDKNDYVIKVDNKTYIRVSKHHGAKQRLDLLNKTYLTLLNDILTSIYEAFELDYSNQGYIGFTLYDAGTVMVSFENLENLKHINIPFTVVQIIDTTEEHPMFNRDENLKSVVFNDNLQIIGTNAFRELVNIKNVTFRKSLIEIRAQAFEQCTSLTTVLMPDTTTLIGDRAFRATAINKVILPQSITDIGSKAFGDIDNGLEVYLMSNPATVQIAPDAFDITEISQLVIYVHDKYLDEYRDKLPNYSIYIHPLSGVYNR